MRRNLLLIVSFFVLSLGIFGSTTAVYAADCYIVSESVGIVCNSEAPEAQFVKPKPFADSFLPYVSYAKLSDFANVYAGPSAGSGVVRNVGDGFLFVTLQGVVENAEGTWYAINFNEYVHSDDIRIVDDSEFTGFESSRPKTL